MISRSVSVCDTGLLTCKLVHLLLNILGLVFTDWLDFWEDEKEEFFSLYT